jgi:hypothetical protein
MIFSAAISAKNHDGTTQMMATSVRASNRNEAIGGALSWIKEYWPATEGYYDYHIFVSPVPDEWLQNHDPI